MKKKIISLFTLALVLVMLVSSMPLSASASGYDAYIYTYQGGYKESAPVYEPITKFNIVTSLGSKTKDVRDIYYAEDGLVYVSEFDEKAGQILVIDPEKDYECIKTINAYNVVDEYGNMIAKTFVKPYGCFVKDGYLYVADYEGGIEKVISGEAEEKEEGEAETETEDNGVAEAAEEPAEDATTEDETKDDATASGKDDKDKVKTAKGGAILKINLNNNNVAELIIDNPKGTGILDTFQFMPTSVSVDYSGQIYVISRGEASDDGLMVFDKYGNFQTFMGAQKVTLSASQIFWRIFQTAAQRERSEKKIPAEYNNMAIDNEGFIYVTTSALDPQLQYSALTSKDKSSDNAPIKRLNPSGEDVLRRAGFYPPAGDISLSAGDSTNLGSRISLFVDIDVNDMNMYVAADSNNCRLFLYDYDGQLMCAFGGKHSSSLGKFTSIAAVTFCGDDLLVLDKNDNTITVFGLSDYGKGLYEALRLQEKREYKKSLAKFEELLPLNANIDFVYVSMGKAYLRNGDYEKAMEYFRNVGDKENYSVAYKYSREGTLNKIAIFIPVVAIILIWLFAKLLGRINKMNKEDDLMKIPSEKFSHKLLYAFRCLTHPFDGFYEMKRSKRGTVSAATTILLATAATLLIDAYFSGYLFVDGEKGDVNIIVVSLGIILPVLVWTLANWCVSSLLYGNGSFKDIYMVACYSLLPIILIVIPTTLISNVLTIEEGAILSFIEGLAYTWAILLIFLGTLTAHSYGLGKNIIATILSLLGMVIIVFMILLVFVLTTKVYTFFETLVTEISYRV